MEESFFGFDDGVKEKKDADAKKIECESRSYLYNPLAFLVEGVFLKPDKYENEWKKYIYPMELEGRQYLASTNGHKIHYIPSEHKSLFEVEKIDKGRVTLREQEGPWAADLISQKKDTLVRVFPNKEFSFEVECDAYECSYHKEFFPILLHKLSGGVVYFNFDYLASFVKHFSRYPFGVIKIYAPGNSARSPWRLEYWGQNQELFYGMLIAPTEMFKTVSEAADLYKTPKYTTAPRQEAVDYVDENDSEPEQADENIQGDPDVAVDTCMETAGAGTDDDIPF